MIASDKRASCKDRLISPVFKINQCKLCIIHIFWWFRYLKYRQDWLTKLQDLIILSVKSTTRLQRLIPGYPAPQTYQVFLTFWRQLFTPLVEWRQCESKVSQIWTLKSLTKPWVEFIDLLSVKYLNYLTKPVDFKCICIFW